MQEKTGPGHALLRLNLRLAERLDRMTSVTFLDSTPWFEIERADDARLWHAAKIPYRNEVFSRAVRDIKSVVRASAGGSRKLVLLDLDGTLWGGVVGELGWESIRLGGHDPLGEAFVDFQGTLQMLTRRGVILGIVSKNDEHVALSAIERHPEMRLRRRDFAAWRINWDDKAKNVFEIARELNIGLSSVVFIDDNRVERERVRDACPQVLVPEWPLSPLAYSDALLALGCFDAVAVTVEDRRRGDLYAAEAARAAARIDAGSAEDWLRRLDLKIEVEEMGEPNAPRAVQLLNKTNQMNLSTRRMGEAEFDEWLRSGLRKAWTFRVSDRFGDAGLCGLVSLDVQGGCALLTDFVLSCRVFGRKVEQTMLHHAILHASRLGATRLRALFTPTPKNGPCRRFLESSGLSQETENGFSWSLSESYALPPEVTLIHREAERQLTS
jgi:FkbH-like protein